ncbi:hypothetical protein [Actinoallomurus acaciae]|uniref:Uncharacterized protein n=1 Tax=Actinoallomurus acaciae TaxID=502577 RepID=A0ABV5YGP8_9ACTN
MSTVEPSDHPGDGALTRHYEGTETVRDCRWASGTSAARPREAGRDIGRIVQIDAWIGFGTEREGAERADSPDSRRCSGEHSR